MWKSMLKTILLGQGKMIAAMIIGEAMNKLSPPTQDAIKQGILAAFRVAKLTENKTDDKILTEICNWTGIEPPRL